MSKKRIAFTTASVAFMLSLVAAGLLGQSGSDSGLYKPLSIFNEAFSLVRSSYVEEESADRLIEGAFSGLTDAIDEFSYYVPPSQMAHYKKGPADSGATSLGMVVTKKFGYAYVISAVPGSAAAKGGVERGDIIEKIDGLPTQPMSIWQVRSALLLGTRPVRVTVLRGGLTKRDEFSIKRESFQPAAPDESIMGDVALIKIPWFAPGSAAQFRQSLADVRQSGKKKLIVDVRGNAGGSSEEAIAAADALLSKGLITSIVGRRAEPKSWQADRQTDFDGEVLVLTDGSTAAAGEVFAAAIRGNQRGRLVGVPTYGKSVVQKFIVLPSGGGLFMTVGHYTTPDLKPIKEQGVRPDVMVDMTSLALRDPEKKKSDKPEEDLILRKALSLFGETAAVVKLAA
ncbi:MAG TPA: S41 family peptidase [Thermoanaerobaculia bacterium]|nr:S41 family peptidase [Thermoanaerobaculia bacterium]